MATSERERIADLIGRMNTMLSDPYLALTNGQCAAVKYELQRLADARFPEGGKEETSVRAEDPDLEAAIDDLVEFGADSFWQKVRYKAGPSMPNTGISDATIEQLRLAMETAVREWWSCNKSPKKGGV